MKFDRLVVPGELLDRVVAHARAELANECCGLLAGRIAGGVGSATEQIPITNALASPTEYETDARDLLAAFRRLREGGLELLAVYHSHPASDPVPSRRDVERNTYGETVVHLIVGLGGEVAVRAWWLTDTGYRAAEWETSPSEPERERGPGAEPRSRSGSDGGAPDYNARTSRTPPAGPPPMTRLPAVAGLLAASAAALPQPPAKPAGVTFRVKLAADQVGKPPESGRVLVAVGPADGVPDFTNYVPPVLPVLGADADAFTADKTITLDAASDVFPEGGLAKLPAGEYTVQAVFATNRDVNVPFAPGNRYCKPVKVKLDPAAGTAVALTLDRTQADDVPKDTATHKYLSLPSKLLSDFHGRPMVYRVAVVLPPDFAKEPDKKYGLIVDVGGFGTRYTRAGVVGDPDPRFVQLIPDGAGPFGDPYQVDSANNGPYGAALTTEVIPHVEKLFRCGGSGKARFTCGGSTGGWVSLALQLYYPDVFNGCWSQCPDSVTFERFELIDIYTEPNAYVNRFGFDRPGTRTLDGDTVSTVRWECRLEGVLGRGGRWELGGRDWASWNAVYGPKGKDGLPVPLWDKAGVIDKAVLDHWRKYDLKRHLTENWKELGPKLAGGKVHIWVGDSDDYFLNAAVRRLKDAADKLKAPAFDGTILIEARKGHDSGGWTRKEMLAAMEKRMR